MADINGVVLSAGSGPTVKYTITYSKSRPNNSQMTYNFTIAAALGSSGPYIHSGSALLCPITVNGSSGQVRIKAADNDNWDGTAATAELFEIVGMGALDAGSKDAALVLELEPGIYTAQISGVGDSIGVALAEIYEAP